MLELIAGPDDDGRRLDRILRKALPDYSLSLIHRLLRQKKITVNGKTAKQDTRITTGAIITLPIIVNHEKQPVNKPNLVNPYTDMVNKKHLPHVTVIRSSDIPHCAILYRDSGIIIFNKPAGIASHGPKSLDTLVKEQFAQKAALPDAAQSLSFQPGPLHRLDKPTSGAIAFSETLAGARLFSRLLREHALIKTYLAIVEGAFDGETVWQNALARDSYRKKTVIDTGEQAKNAVTAVKSLATNGAYTLIEARIHTGRTHQIRAQAAACGHPLAGDVKYGGQRLRRRQHPPLAHSSMRCTDTASFFLHAWKLELDGETEMLSGFPRPLIAVPPAAFQLKIQELFLVTGFKLPDNN